MIQLALVVFLLDVDNTLLDNHKERKLDDVEKYYPACHYDRRHGGKP